TLSCGRARRHWSFGGSAQPPTRTPRIRLKVGNARGFVLTFCTAVCALRKTTPRRLSDAGTVNVAENEPLRDGLTLPSTAPLANAAHPAVPGRNDLALGADRSIGGGTKQPCRVAGREHVREHEGVRVAGRGRDVAGSSDMRHAGSATGYGRASAVTRRAAARG